MPPRNRLRLLAVAGLVLSILLVAGVVAVWWPATAPDPGVTPRAPVVETPRIPDVTSVAPPTGAVPTPEVVAPQPTRVLRVELPTAGYSSDVGTMAIGDSGVIDPPDFVRAWWIEDRGVLPGSRAADTTYLACHTDAARPAMAVPCNRLALEKLPTGGKVLVQTDAEALSYTITQARKVLRDDFAHDSEVWDVNPGRLVLVSCYLSGGRRTDYNIVVIAEVDRPAA